MQIGEIIRHYRKSQNMTQEEMANRLGVTAPAVNKWENGASMPDIMLLAPIARLLGITLDTLLSFRDALTPEEINGIIREMDAMFQTKSYDEVFEWARKKLQEYPSCEQLIWQIAVVLDARRMTGNILGEGKEETDEDFFLPFTYSPKPPAAGATALDQPSTAGQIEPDRSGSGKAEPDRSDPDKYDRYICSLYERVLKSHDEALRTSGADSLFGFYMRKEDYDKAGEYLRYFSSQNPERKRKQAELHSAAGRTREAFKAWEELLFAMYGMINACLNGMYMAALKANDMDKAHLLVEKEIEMAQSFEMGKYYEAAPKLELAAIEKDTETVITTMKEMLTGMEQISSFCRSRLYEHMDFRPLDPAYISNVKKGLLKCFGNEETFGFLKGDKRWQELVRR